MTPHAKGHPDDSLQRVRPANLEQLAIALLEYRRTDKHDRSVPSVDHLAARLSLARSTVVRRLRELGEVETVHPLAKGYTLTDLADALEAMFPYLAEYPRSLSDPA